MLEEVNLASLGPKFQIIQDILKTFPTDNMFDIIMGDFNCPPTSINPLFKYLKKARFAQIILEPSHVKGNILDHIYFKSSNFHASVKHKPCYYSDHDALCVSINLHK